MCLEMSVTLRKDCVVYEMEQDRRDRMSTLAWTTLIDELSRLENGDTREDSMPSSGIGSFTGARVRAERGAGEIGERMEEIGCCRTGSRCSRRRRISDPRERHTAIIIKNG